MNTAETEVQELNRAAHVVTAVILLSSTGAVQLLEEDQQLGDNNSSTAPIPTFEGIEINRRERTINLSSVSTRQKIAFMITSYRYEDNISESKIIGGIHLKSASSKTQFKERIERYKQGRPIKPLITADLEGCIEPTSKFRDFKSFAEVNTSEQAFSVGKIQGSFLADIGVDLNFSPVVDLNDSIWGCRAFPGDYKQVSKKACSYIQGLHYEGIMATAKHYPGKTLTGKDPHKKMKTVKVSKEDTYPFASAINCSVDAIMPSHQISSGVMSTSGKPADVSQATRNVLRNQGFEGIIVSDAISMEGLKGYYDSKTERYVDLFRTNDMILNLVGGKNDTRDMVNTVNQAVKDGELDEKHINKSVLRLLKARGWGFMGRS